MNELIPVSLILVKDRKSYSSSFRKPSFALFFYLLIVAYLRKPVDERLMVSMIDFHV